MTATGTEARVCADIAARQAKGIAKYGKTVEGNPLGQREWLQHAYEECLDQAVYLRRLMEEMDAKARQDLLGANWSADDLRHTPNSFFQKFGRGAA